MRALLSTIGSRGDVQPLVALALELKALGHEVRLCVPPDFREWIEGFGLPVTPIGPEVRKSAASSAPPAAVSPSAEQRRSLVEESVATQFATITEAARDCDVIVAATAIQVAARSVAEKLGIPYAFAAYSPTVLPSPHHPPPALPPVPGQSPLPQTTDNRELWARNAARFNETFAASLNAHRTAAGLVSVSDVRGYMFTDRPWLAADSTLGPWPDPADDGVFQTGAWILEDQRPLSREVETFLDAGELPLYFGFGSATRVRATTDVGDAMVRAARALGRRAIVSRGWAGLSVADDEPDVLSIGEANLQMLFTRVAAVVHHGGAGTTTLTALAGAPHVVVPHVYDQYYWAKRVQELGIGTAHASGTPTMESLTSALEQTLKLEVAVRARSVATAIRRDGALVAAQAIVARV
jgi:vancomycin aglycone glucosyltransferase